jgi:NADH-quinone oxidoreductase subunit C
VDAAAILSALQTALPGAACEIEPATDRPTLVVPRDRLLDVARVLRDDPGLRFLVLTEVTAVDWWPADPRFVVVYHLLAPERRGLLRLKVKLASDDAHVATLCGVWPSANWLEREVYDLFGVVFEGHPDLRRLMMPDDWEGHPLRKDYPVQIKMTPKVYEPLQMSEEEFHARIAADRRVRTKPKAREPKA